MALLTPGVINLDGVYPEDVDAAAAGAGDTFANNGKVLFYIANEGGAPISVTFDDSGTPTPSGTIDAFDPDVTIVVTNAKWRLIGPFPVARFGTTVAVTYTSETSVMVAPLRI